MNNTLEYKGYITRIEYSSEDKLLFGKIEGIVDHVDFFSESPNEIENEFHIAVDDYLVFCEDVGQPPDRAFSGAFNVRIAPELHRELWLEATRNDEKLNTTVVKALKNYLEKDVAAQTTNHIYFQVPQVKNPKAFTSSNVSTMHIGNKFLVSDFIGQ